MTKLTIEECMDLAYILKEMGIRTNHYRDVAKSSEEYLAFDIFTDKISDLIDKIEEIREDLVNEKYTELPFN